MSAPLPTRALGRSGIAVGAIGLGCMGMSWAYGAPERDDARSVATIHRALELGVTLIDTSDVYGPFTNEELVGRALAGRRDRAVVATKAALWPSIRRRPGRCATTAARGTSRAPPRPRRGGWAWMIDLYQLHRVDPAVPLEETWGAMAELVRAGKVRALSLGGERRAARGRRRDPSRRIGAVGAVALDARPAR
ncbi:MAG: aldo/keto reductase [Solirubrobacteraceae bacterium]